ncbi:zinc/cadmium resistance protein [Rhizophagus clarus]|uniref:Zinc/cadmium resistance protein n=1 Tax=Rhizophagus clarus TaxID=94130 RepID=A0A8H3MBI8_9GLOM|nr:zinc/cadmium resistance protein [Rhizophagus clarus]
MKLTRQAPLIADSFHMLNDIFSLVIALYALKLASKTTFSSKYSYGWQRAEILGALVNGVFLVALCLSIFLQAIERFIDPPEIKSPKIMLGVGCAGLFSNIIGLLLFHEHSHEHSHGHTHDHGKKSADVINADDSIVPIDEILVHPAASRRSIVKAAQESRESREFSENINNDTIHSNSSNNENISIKEESSQCDTDNKQKIPEIKNDHDHKSREKKHKNLNMYGVFIHVLGDALGNIGVICSGLFIYLTNFSWRFYADPLISLILTIIILTSAIPLVKSASYILLQKVPSGIPIDDVRLKIKELCGVLSVHELHIWQLSDTKRICSVHILLAPSANYMEIAADIRKVLHAYGVHSVTIQPEYVKIGLNRNDGGEVIMVVENSAKGVVELVANDVDNHETACLLRCNLDSSCTPNLCCPSPVPTTTN